MVRYGAVDPLTARARVNGFSPPMTQNQLMFLVGNSGSVVSFYVATSIFLFSTIPLEREQSFFINMIKVHLVLCLVGLCCWLYIEMHDPSIPSCFGNMLPSSRKWTVARYVSEHRKPIEGLDHFCSWLNVAIARSNYIPFFTLTTCGVCQYGLQCFVCCLMITFWHDDLIRQVATPEDPEALVATALIFLVALSSLCIAFPFAMLLFFHLTLISSGETTYTYVQNAQKAQLKLRRERAANQNQVSETTSLTGGGGKGDTAVLSDEQANSQDSERGASNASSLEEGYGGRGAESPPPGQLLVSDQVEMWGGTEGPPGCPVSVLGPLVA